MVITDDEESPFTTSQLGFCRAAGPKIVTTFVIEAPENVVVRMLFTENTVLFS